MPMNCYTRNFEDVLIQRALADVEDGFYLDIGASHPVIDSNTYALYQRGWHGIAVEPLPIFSGLWKTIRNRDLHLEFAAAAHNGQTAFWITPHALQCNTTQPEIADAINSAGQHPTNPPQQVPCRTLTDILDSHAVDKPIHLLSVDVEGDELNVLKGLDLSRYRPWLIVLEATLPGSPIPNHEKWHPILEAANYGFEYFDGVNRFYLANEHRHLSSRLRLPPNVWDRFRLNAQQAGIEDPASDQDLEHATSLVNSGQPAAAEVLLKLIVQRNPNHASAWNGMALALMRLHRWEEAENACWHVIRLAPDNYQQWCNLLTCLAESSAGSLKITRIAAMVAHLIRDWSYTYRDALSRENASTTLETLYDVLDKHGYRECALDLAQLAISFNETPSTRRMLASALASRRRFDEASPLLQSLAAEFPENLQYRVGYANTLVECGKVDQGCSILRELLNAYPDHPQLVHNLMYALQFKNKQEECIDLLDKIIERDPDNAASRYARASFLIRKGDYKKGFEDYEARAKSAMRDPDLYRDYEQLLNQGIPVWDGSPLDGRSLFVIPEQGHGDFMMCARFLPYLLTNAHANKVCFYSSRNLERYARALPLPKAITYSLSIPKGDNWQFVPILSLMHRLKITAENDIPAPLAPMIDPAMIALWRQRVEVLSNNCQRMIGIAWRGSQVHSRDKDRSIEFDTFVTHLVEPVLRTSSQIRMVSLQYDASSSEQARLQRLGVDTELIKQCTDWYDTAALVSQLHALCSVDTALVHLCGTLNVPTIMLNRIAGLSDWRWLNERSDTPWYPSVQIISQAQHRDWLPVLSTAARMITGE